MEGRLERRDRYSVAPEAVREALVNMIAHRDYSRTPPCVVHLTPSRVMFFSVGGPADLTEEEILLQIATNCRNVRLANFLKALHLMEGTGSEFNTIRHAYNNIPLSQLIQVLSTSFLISLPQKNFVEDTDKSFQSNKISQSAESAISNYFHSKGKATLSDIVNDFNIPRSTVSYWLRKMVAENRLLKAGSGRNTFYVSNSK